MAEPRANDLLPWLRRMSLAEGVSWVLLLGAMGLRWLSADLAMGVRVTGMIHGILFLVLCWLLVRARFEKGWPLGRVFVVFGAALVPFCAFAIDRRMRAWISVDRPAG